MRLEIKLEPRDLWIGLFWDKRENWRTDGVSDDLHLYLCLIPMIVIHIVISKERPEVEL